MVLSSDNDTGIVYTFQVPQSVIRQRLQITRSIETYAYPEIISICDLCVFLFSRCLTVPRSGNRSATSDAPNRGFTPRFNGTEDDKLPITLVLLRQGEVHPKVASLPPCPAR